MTSSGFVNGASQWSELVCLSVRWYVLDAETTDLVAIHTDGNEQLSVMRFSVGGWSPVKAFCVSVNRWTTCPTIPLWLCRWQPAGHWLPWQLYLPVHRLWARAQVQQIREVLSKSAPLFFFCFPSSSCCSLLLTPGDSSVFKRFKSILQL